jgi:hypothetical protein
MISFGVLAFDAYSKKENYWLIIWLLSAVIINPIIKIPLGRFYWNIVDVIWSVLIFINILFTKENINFKSINNSENILAKDINQKIRKIIAREFLISMGVIFIALLVVLYANVSNYFNNSRLETQSHQIEKKIEHAKSLSKPYDLKNESQSVFYSSFESQYDLNITKDEFWGGLENLAKKDSIEYFWNKVWDAEQINSIKDAGFGNPQELRNFILEYSLDEQEISNYNKAKKLYYEADSLRNYNSEISSMLHNDSEIQDLVYFTIIVSIIIFFAFRYLYYAIVWSIKTLKE